MKKGSRRFFGLLFTLCFVLALAGCGASSAADTNLSAVSNPQSTSGENGTGSAVIVPGEREIVYTADLSIECSDAKAAADTIRSDTAATGGYIESSSLDAGSEYTQCMLTARIPVEKYAAFMAGTDAYGSVTRKSENTDDITSSYVDTQAHIQALNEQKASLEQMLANAADLDSMLQIQSQLTDVLYQLDSYESQLRLMDDQVRYCTVNFTLTQPMVVSSASRLFGSRVTAAWHNGIQLFVSFIQGLILAVVLLFPFLVLGAAIFFLVRFCRKHMPKKPKKQPSCPPYFGAPYGAAPYAAPRPGSLPYAAPMPTASAAAPAGPAASSAPAAPKDEPRA